MSAPDVDQCLNSRTAMYILAVPGRYKDVDHSKTVRRSISLSSSIRQHFSSKTLVKGFEKVASRSWIRRFRGECSFSVRDEIKRLFRLSIEESIEEKRTSSAAKFDLMTALWVAQCCDDIKPSGLDVMSCFNSAFSRSVRGANISLSGWTRILQMC